MGKEGKVMKSKYLAFLLVFMSVLVSCDKNNSNSVSVRPSNSTSESINDKPSTSVPPSISNISNIGEYKIESAEGYEIDYDSYQYPTLKKTVSNKISSVTLNNEIKVSNGCTWILSKDIEGSQTIATKNMSLQEGHNNAYITVWDSSKNNNKTYYIDIYRLSMFSYAFYSDNTKLYSGTLEENQMVNEPTNQPTKEGNTFVDWYDEEGIKVDFPYVIKSNKTFTAKWAVNKYTINFDTDGGSAIDQIAQDYGTEIVKPNNPTREGYTFIGWDKEIPDTMPAESITIKALWKINKYTITFDTNGGSTIDSIIQYYGTDIVKPNNPTKEGYTFIGWDKEIPDKMPASDMAITAKWKVNKYAINFDTDGGTTIDSITQDYGTDIIKPSNPTKEGYTFIGWDKEIPSTMPAENITIKSLWKINKYTITFDTDGGTTIDSITQDYGTDIIKPNDPTKEEGTFIGWDKEIPSTMPAENITIKALWKINKYTISFDTDGGTTIDSITQDYGTNIVKPTDPTKKGYTFIGWDKEIPDAMPAENITIKALWKMLPPPTSLRFTVIRPAIADSTLIVDQTYTFSVCPIPANSSNDISISSISDEEVISVTMNEKNDVTVTALKPGKSTITFKSNMDEKVTKSITFIVTAPIDYASIITEKEYFNDYPSQYGYTYTLKFNADGTGERISNYDDETTVVDTFKYTISGNKITFKNWSNKDGSNVREFEYGLITLDGDRITCSCEVAMKDYVFDAINK